MSSVPPTIGVLALQGDVREHIHALEQAGARARRIRRPDELDSIDGLILPGGESTTMGRLAAVFGLLIAPLAWVAANVPGAAAIGISGIGAAPAMVALFAYSLLPVVANTVVGLEGVPPAATDAAKGMGMTGWQRLATVEFPLAFPVILTGIRIVLVQNIGLATIAALIGGGGFGVFVFQGIGQTAMDLVLLGAVPTRILVIATGGMLVMAGLLVTLRFRGSRASVAVLLATTTGATWLSAGMPSPCERESPYYCIAVNEEPGDPTRRLLVLDNLHHAFVDTDEPTHLEFAYVRWFAAAASDVVDAGRFAAVHIGGGGITFDATARNVCTVKRSRSNTPLQALTLLNDPVFVEAAEALAARVLKELPDASDDARLAHAFRLCVSRPPRNNELSVLRDLLTDQRRARASHKNGETLAWIDVASALLNLDETLNK